jgi:hypothetical protein
MMLYELKTDYCKALLEANKAERVSALTSSYDYTRLCIVEGMDILGAIAMTAMSLFLIAALVMLIKSMSSKS